MRCDEVRCWGSTDGTLGEKRPPRKPYVVAGRELSPQCHVDESSD